MKKAKLFFVLSSIALLAVVAGIYYVKFVPDGADSSADISITYTTLPEPVSVSDDVNSDSIENIRKSLSKSYMLIPVQPIEQLPELPTGCEITSLTTVLNYLGFEVDKEYMARNYLAKLTDFSGSFYDYFIGSPWNASGMGCFAPAITNSANRYLSDANSSLQAYNISNSSINALFAEVSNGNPVIVWTSSQFDEVTQYTDIVLNDKSIFRWPNNEHCVTLIGFNIAKKTVTLADPQNGVVERDLNTFISRYNELYKQAVVIK